MFKPRFVHILFKKKNNKLSNSLFGNISLNMNYYMLQEIPESQIDTKSAYILFYERENIDLDKIMPDVTGKEPDMTEIDDEFESDFKKMCVLQ